MNPYALLDLHIHFDGAITVEIARKLSQLQQISLPKNDEDLKKMLSVSENCQSLDDFLHCFTLPLSLLQTQQSISQGMYLVLEHCKSQHLQYVEIRFAPQLHTQKGLSQKQVILAALEGLHRSSIPANIILCCMRGDAQQKAQNLETVQLAKEFLTTHGGVVAIDLAGAEGIFPTKNFEYIFTLAKQYHIPFTIHAGEADGADSIRTAVAFGACRIGHGVRLFEDDSLFELVKNKNITLELCPTSNQKTKAISDLKHYPLQQYLKQGISVTLNTDDPAICNTTLAQEFSIMETVCHLTQEQQKQICMYAIDAAFTTETVKQYLRNQIL